MPKFEPNTNPRYKNEILKGKDFYLSYNPQTGTNSLLADFASALTGNENGKEETALYSHGVWYILNGDFRKEYEEAFDGGFDACAAVYKRNIAHRSGWSTDFPPEGVQ